MTNQPQEISFVGLILINILSFARLKFDNSVVFIDKVKDEEALSGELFVQNGTRWFVRPESLPGYLYLKAIGFDKEALYLETSPIDELKMTELRMELKESFYSFAQVGTTEIPTFGQSKLAPRVLWTIPLDVLEMKNGVLNFIDRIFEQGAFLDQPENEESKVETGSAPAVTKQAMEMKLQLQLMQQLQIEQRPILSMQKVGQMKERMELTQIQAMFAFQLNVLNMSEAELIDFTVKKLAEIGEERLLQAFTFVIAGRLKKAKPQITWPEARRIARKLQRSPLG